jgi:DUF4097 and DUF4098 domain-containing protein YvlB
MIQILSITGTWHTKTAATFGTALLLASSAAAAPRHIEKHFKVDPRPVVTIHNLNGTITVKAWTRPEVKLVVDSPSDRVDIDADQSGNRVDLAAHANADNVSPDEMRANFELMVPEDTELQIHDDSGSVDVSDVMGDMAVDTIAAGVALQDAAGYLTIKTVGGTVQCLRCAGRIEINSISGNVRLIDLRSYSVRAQTAAGNILFDGEFLANGTYRLKNYSGLIEVRFSPLDSFGLSATSVKGKVINEANLTSSTSGSRGYDSKFSHSLVGKLNQGKAKVELASFDGTISIHRRD